MASTLSVHGSPAPQPGYGLLWIPKGQRGQIAFSTFLQSPVNYMCPVKQHMLAETVATASRCARACCKSELHLIMKQLE